jgi:serine/threonine-protein kinase
MSFEAFQGETTTPIFPSMHELITVVPAPFAQQPEPEEGEETQVDASAPTESTRARPMSRSTPPPATWAPGAVIPGTIYRVIRPLGVGGMGEVYEAEHELLGVRRALKVLGKRLTSREDLAERLRIEARALARLKHPNLVEVNDLGVAADGRVFFAMELLSGATLRELLLRTGALQLHQALVIATQVLDALDAAHRENMVHRDVKPENVFLQRSGVVKLLDFGVAKALQGNQLQSPLTAAGVAIGTPRYMAPEQAQGQQVDQRSDVFAMGLVLWEMLAGRPPYHHLDALTAVVTVASQGLPDIRTAGVEVPADVHAALKRATARIPAERYPSAAAFAAELRAARARLDGSAVSVEKVTARYETSLTSLMPVLGDITAHDPGEATTTGTTQATQTSTTPTSSNWTQPDLPPSVLEPTEALLLRSSLPFDPRSQLTPTSIPQPASPSRPPPEPAAPPATPATPPPLAAPPSRGAPWLLLPLTVLASITGTWLLLRPPPPPAATAFSASAPIEAPAAVPSDTAPLPAVSATASALPASTPGPSSVAPPAPSSITPRPQGKGRPAEPRRPPPAAVLPGSGL